MKSTPFVNMAAVRRIYEGLARSYTNKMVQSSAFSSSSYPAAAHPNTLSAASRSFTHLARYLESPLHVPSVEAFQSLAANVASLDRSGTTPLILDSGCGLGRSTRRIAESNPESIVIGVDRSEHRLRKGDSAEGSALPENALFVQAELATFWRSMIR